jgi:hypothetical protein
MGQRRGMRSEIPSTVLQWPKNPCKPGRGMRSEIPGTIHDNIMAMCQRGCK